MVKAKKILTTGKPRIRVQISKSIPAKREPSLLMLRLKELDEEFVRQTKQLAKVTKKLTKKISDKLQD